MFKNVKMIEERDWDILVQSTYNRVYDFQQQEVCNQLNTWLKSYIENGSN